MRVTFDSSKVITLDKVELGDIRTIIRFFQAHKAQIDTLTDLANQIPLSARIITVAEQANDTALVGVLKAIFVQRINSNYKDLADITSILVTAFQDPQFAEQILSDATENAKPTSQMVSGSAPNAAPTSSSSSISNLFSAFSNLLSFSWPTWGASASSMTSSSSMTPAFQQHVSSAQSEPSVKEQAPSSSSAPAP